MSAEDSARLSQHVFSLSEYNAAKSIFVFIGAGHEPDTSDIIDRALCEGKIVAVPKCIEDGRMEARRILSRFELMPGKYGIPEPLGTCPVLDKSSLDLILVPALAFDHTGHRLGRGLGYYDRYLKDYRGLSIGLCASRALTKMLPKEAFDVPMPLIVTEKGPVHTGGQNVRFS